IEEGLDARPIGRQLLLQSLEQPRQALDQHALGRRNRRRATKLVGPSENLQALRCRLWPPQLVGVEEFFPFTFARHLQGGRGREGQHESPGVRGGPVVKGLQSRWIILFERGQDLIDQGGALLNESYFITTEGAQFTGQRIQGRKG